MSIVRLRGVGKRFEDVQAVRNATLEVEQGEFLALLGPSGCGKTTLLRLVAGFERPDAGEIRLEERTVADARTWVVPVRRRVGMVFQDYALFPHLTIAENVGFGLGRKERAARVPIMLELVLLDEPWSNIDPHLRTLLRDEVARILRKVDVTVLLVTHDREEAFSLADRIALMRDGTIVQSGTPEDVYFAPATEWAGQF